MTWIRSCSCTKQKNCLRIRSRTTLVEHSSAAMMRMTRNAGHRSAAVVAVTVTDDCDDAAPVVVAAWTTNCTSPVDSSAENGR